MLYEVPKVRQFHESPETEHIVDWADLFFDLTYVAAAFQLGKMFISEVSWLAAFKFAVVALCLHDAWRFKTLHDSTFCATDVVHKLLDIIYMCSVASAAVFIQPNSAMENMNTSYAFGLSLSLAVNVAVLGVEKLEIYVRSKVLCARKYVEIEFLRMYFQDSSCTQQLQDTQECCCIEAEMKTKLPIWFGHILSYCSWGRM